MKKPILLIAAAILCGCTTTTVLVNDKGEERYCSSHHMGSWDAIAANKSYTDCLNELGKQGFKPKP